MLCRELPSTTTSKRLGHCEQWASLHLMLTAHLFFQSPHWQKSFSSCVIKVESNFSACRTPGNKKCIHLIFWHHFWNWSQNQLILSTVNVPTGRGGQQEAHSARNLHGFIWTSLNVTSWSVKYIIYLLFLFKFFCDPVTDHSPILRFSG